MSNPGMGVMIGWLGGNEETVKSIQESIGKTITKVVIDSDDKLNIEFEGGTVLTIWDDGQSCCEHRYMTSDDVDSFDYYVGAKFLGAELREADNIEREYDVHEAQFLDIKTDKGVFTLCTHNEHNGYYGGFWVVARLYQKE